MEEISTCSPWRGPHAGADVCLKEVVTPWGACTGAGSCQDLWTREGREAHNGAGLLAGLVTPWRTHAGAACSSRTASHWKDPSWGSLWRTASCGKDSRWSSLWRSVFIGRDLKLEQGQSVRSPPPEEGE